MQPDKFTLAAEWRSMARENERIAAMLVEESPATAAFLAHQAAEKALKAACIVVGEDTPRTHVVNYLLDELANNGITVSDDVRDAARLGSIRTASSSLTTRGKRSRHSRQSRSSSTR